VNPSKSDGSVRPVRRKSRAARLARGSRAAARLKRAICGAPSLNTASARGRSGPDNHTLAKWERRGSDIKRQDTRWRSIESLPEETSSGPRGNQPLVESLPRHCLLYPPLNDPRSAAIDCLSSSEYPLT